MPSYMCYDSHDVIGLISCLTEACQKSQASWNDVTCWSPKASFLIMAISRDHLDAVQSCKDKINEAEQRVLALVSLEQLMGNSPTALKRIYSQRSEEEIAEILDVRRRLQNRRAKRKSRLRNTKSADAHETNLTSNLSEMVSSSSFEAPQPTNAAVSMQPVPIPKLEPVHSFQAMPPAFFMHSPQHSHPLQFSSTTIVPQHYWGTSFGQQHPGHLMQPHTSHVMQPPVFTSHHGPFPPMQDMAYSPYFPPATNS